MSRDIIKYILVFAAFFVISFYTHHAVLESKAINLRFSLKNIYIFHSCISAIICIHIKILASIPKLYPQVGFLYLATFIVKLILFFAFFYVSVFTIDVYELVEKMSLLIPLFIFLFLEVFFVVNILNRK